MKIKVKNMNKKLLTWHRAIVINSIVALVILAIFALFKYGLVKDLQAIEIIDKICSNVIVYNFLVFVVFFLTYTIIMKYACKKIRFWQLLVVCLIAIAFKVPLYIFNLTYLNLPIDIVYMLVSIIILKGSIKRGIIVIALTTIVQILISCIHSYWLNDILNNHISLYFILNIDLFIVMYNFYKGGEKICGDVSYSGESQVGSTQSQDSFLVSLKFHITSWLASSKTLRKVTQKEKQSKNKRKIDVLDIVYIILYIAWNLFTIWLVYRMARNEGKLIEMLLLVLAFVVNKGVFGRPLHLSADACFIVSLIVFYTISKSLPMSSLSILLPIMIGVSIAMISNIVQELLFDDKTLSLREKVIVKTKGDNSQENIFNICKSKGWTDDKAKDISLTVFTYLNHSQYETAEIVCCDNRTVTRRVNEFLKD